MTQDDGRGAKSESQLHQKDGKYSGHWADRDATHEEPTWRKVQRRAEVASTLGDNLKDYPESKDKFAWIDAEEMSGEGGHK